MSILRSIGKSRIGELAEVCRDALIGISPPAASIIRITLPGLDTEALFQGHERHLPKLENAIRDYGLGNSAKSGHIPGFISINLDDGQSLAIGIIKYMGNFVGYVAAIGDDIPDNRLTLSETVWLCTSQLALRIHTILSPTGPLAVEILGRRILRALHDSGVKTLALGPVAGQEPWISLYRESGMTFAKEIERVPQDQVASINSGEIIGENTLNYLWSGLSVAVGVWISSEAGYYVAVGFEERKLPNPKIISRIREQIETSARSDYEYLIKSFEKLKKEFDRLIKSERAAAITETTVTINHEINNPLTAILGNTQLLLMSKDKLPADTISKLQTIERSAVKIRETTSKLMSIIEPVTTPYVSGLEMIDIEKSKKREPK
jgi:signal transduction histidine kinase